MDSTPLHLLIAHDGSEQADRAVDAAASLFPDASATVLHVSKSFIDWGVAQHGWSIDKELYDTAVLEAAQRRLDAAAERVESAGLDVVDRRLRTTARSAWKTILHELEHGSFDVLVIGTHGHGGAHRIGSVTQALLTCAPVPVLVVPMESDPERLADSNAPVVIGFDGSPESHHALAVLAKVLPGCRALMTAVWESLPGWVLSPPPVSPSFGPAFDEEAETNAKTLVEAGVATATRSGLVADGVVRDGTNGVWRTLVQVASDEDARLLCIGSHASSRVAAVALGGVAHSIVARSTIPVLVVRAQQQ